MNPHVFPIPAALASKAHVDARGYEDRYRRSIDDPEGFWREQARILDWSRPFTQVKNTRYAPEDGAVNLMPDRQSCRCASSKPVQINPRSEHQSHRARN
jgi:acetyl-CoA synthetase